MPGTNLALFLSMQIITEDQVYDFKATDVVSICCNKCGCEQARKVASIRVNIKRNDVYMCHKCVTSTPAYLDKQRQSHPKTGHKWNSKVIVKCNNCGIDYSVNYRSQQYVIKNDKKHHCGSCSRKLAHIGGKYKDIYTENFIAELRSNGKKFWESIKENEWKTSYMAHLLDDESYIELMKECGKKPWRDDNYRERMQDDEIKQKRLKTLSKTLESDEYRNLLSINSKKNWENQEYREAITAKTKTRMNSVEGRLKSSDNSKKLWRDPKYREKMAVARANIPRISSIQHMLYGFLRDLAVEFYEESDKTMIGYYVFDCLIPVQNGMRKNLLIECQGDYWHSLPKAISSDKAKFTYINRYFPDHEIMYLWEHEFYTDGRVLDRLKLKLGVDIQTIDFEFTEITIHSDVPSSDIRSFLDSYHYIGKGRGGITLCAKHGNQLIAVAAFSPPLRQNQEDLYGDFRELSRFCIHPSYHKKNFASWLLSRFIKMVDTPKIVAFADSTVGHDGGIYRASNFKFSHEVSPDYWYVDKDGYVLHKRTLYGRASKSSMTESEFADNFGFVKKFGGPKKCYVYG